MARHTNESRGTGELRSELSSIYPVQQSIVQIEVEASGIDQPLGSPDTLPKA